MAGQDFSPQTEGSSGLGAALDPSSPKMRPFAGPEALPLDYFLLLIVFLPFFISRTETGSLFGTPATPAGTK